MLTDFLFIKSDAGSACTSVVTEYRHRTNRHTEPYTIEVEYTNDAEVCDEINELLIVIVNYTLRTLKKRLLPLSTKSIRVSQNLLGIPSKPHLGIERS